MGGVGGGGNAKRKSSEEGGRLLLSLTHLLDLVKLACWCVGMMGGAVMACVLNEIRRRALFGPIVADNAQYFVDYFGWFSKTISLSL